MELAVFLVSAVSKLRWVFLASSAKQSQDKLPNEAMALTSNAIHLRTNIAHPFLNVCFERRAYSLLDYVNAIKKEIQSVQFLN